MNTATRMMGSQTMGLRKVHWFSFGGHSAWSIVLVLGLFISAFSIIYAKDLNRRLLIESQRFEKENVAANERWGKLLLEQSTLARQARIYELAQTRLGMTMPDSNQIEIVKETTVSTEHFAMRDSYSNKKPFPRSVEIAAKEAM